MSQGSSLRLMLINGTYPRTSLKDEKKLDPAGPIRKTGLYR